MSYKIESLKVRNFKCFDKKKFYEFYFLQDANLTILSGPNGFGKTTFFDAIELIFTKRITRLNSEIEDGRTNLGKNILLNTSDECGYLILSLIDSTKKKLTIITEIDNNFTKLTIDTAIKFTYVEGTIDTNKFDDFLMKSIKWEDDISAFDNISYIKEHFNVYYYVSQAESVHFLKNNIATRKDSMTKLLQTEVIQEKINKIERNLIGATKAKKGVIINDEIKDVKTELDKKIYDLKNILEHGAEVYKEVSYNSLLVYPQQCEMKKWDIEKLELKNVSEKQVSEYIAEINSIYNLYQDLSDYKKFLKNKEIESLTNNDEAILNYTKFSMFIKNNIFDFKQIEKEVVRLNRLLDVFKIVLSFVVS